MHGGAPPGGRQIHICALIRQAGASTHLLGDRGEHRLGEIHHRVVVGIGLIHLHGGELRVVTGAHPFIPEDAAQLVHPLEPAHHQPLQVQLRGNPKEQRQIQRVVMGDERAGIRPAGLRLQHRRFDLEELTLVQPTANAAHRQRTASERLPGLGGHDEIQVALAVALLHIRQAMPLVRQRLQRLAEHGPVAHLHRQFPTVGASQDAGHPQPVAGIHQ